MVAPRSIWRFANAFAIACWWFWGVTAGAADSILAGTVTDAITKQPVAGAEVRIEYSGQTVGAGTSDIDGVYRVPFTIPPAAPALITMIASARSGDHGVTMSNFQINAGTPVTKAHDITLFPTGVTECRSKTNHSIIVGHFLPPVGKEFADLSMRIAQSLQYALNTSLQTVRITLALLPSFEPCEAAKPTSRFAANLAKVLRADAFVFGDIAAADESSGFTVSTFVSDAHGLFSNPATVSNRNVNLNSPSGAAMAGETHAAVLASVAAGLAESNDCVTAIAVLSVAERLVDVIPPYVTTLRKTCESRVPNAGLRRPTP